MLPARTPAPRGRPRAGALGAACFALVALAGCRSGPDEAEVAAATLFFPPTFRYVEEPRFCFSAAERERALQGFRELGVDSLFELIVDDSGRVVESRIVRTRVEELYHPIVLEHANAFAFNPDERKGAYRAFYVPMDFRLDSQVIER